MFDPEIVILCDCNVQVVLGDVEICKKLISKKIQRRKVTSFDLERSQRKSRPFCMVRAVAPKPKYFSIKIHPIESTFRPLLCILLLTRFADGDSKVRVLDWSRTFATVLLLIFIFTWQDVCTSFETNSAD